MRPTPSILAALALIASSPSAPAQDKLPHEAATEKATDKPVTVAPAATPPDADLDALRRYLTGSFRSSATSPEPALTLSSAPLQAASMPGAIVVETARADTPGDPFRVCILWPYRRQGALRVRTLELPPGNEMARMLAGLWAAPETLPDIDRSTLFTSLEMPATPQRAPGVSTTFMCQTSAPFPNNLGGAVDVASAMWIGPDGFSVEETGSDAKGERVWGTVGGKGYFFEPSAAKPAVRREDGGLVIITTVAPKEDAARHEPAAEMTFHFTRWTSTGEKIDTSRGIPRDPPRIRIPGAPLKSLDLAMSGMAVGERRKIVIPPGLAYGSIGRGTIPPNATLIFDIECLAVNNTPPAAPPSAPPGHMNPHAPSHAAPVPPRPPSDGPVGSPPTNPHPETPR